MKLLIGILFILVSSNLFSQNLGLNYYSTGAGRNITATVSKSFKKSDFGIGIGYNINSIKQQDDQSNLFYKRLYATKPLYHLSLDVFYNRYFLQKLEYINLFVFGDIQLKYSSTRSSMYLPHSMDTLTKSEDPVKDILYRQHIPNFGPFLWVETYLGVGFDVKIYKSIYFQQKIGFGGYSLIGYDNNIQGKNEDWYEWGFAGIYSFGLVFKFK